MAKNNNKESPTDESEKKPPRKWLFIVLAVLLSLSMIVGGLVLSLGADKALSLVSGGSEDVMDEESHMDTESTHAAEEPEDEHNDKDADLIVMPVKEIIVNIVSITETGRKSTRFLKLNVALVFDNNIAGSEYVTERKIYIRDAFQNYLRQLTERDLIGSIGIVRLKSELLRRARAVTESDAPREVLVADIIVQ